MINNNMEMVKNLKNSFDYKEYVQACKSEGIEPRDLNSYCMGIGILMVGLEMFGKKDWQDSYTKVYAEMRKEDAKPKVKNPKSSCCGGGEKKSPSMIKKAKNYAKTMAKWMKAGRPKVSTAVYAERLGICATCGECIRDEECSICGCPMRDKAMMGLEKLCELNKW